MIYVIARMELNENCLPAMQEILAKTVPQVLSEDGCIMYTPCLDYEAGDEGRFITVVEAWKSLEHQQLHLDTPHMAAFREAVKNLRKGCEVTILSPMM